MAKKDSEKKDSRLIVPGNIEDYPVLIENGQLPPHLEEMANNLSERVIGQERPIRKALRFITIYEAGLNDPRRPAGMLMLAGPSGVGKTYFAKEFAQAWIGPPKQGGVMPWVFIDCGSLSLEHTVSSLTGAPPGYIGYGDQSNLEKIGDYEKDDDHVKKINKWLNRMRGQIFDLLAKNPAQAGEIDERLHARIQDIVDEMERRNRAPRSVVIFDEIEKASKNIQRQLLSIMEEGQLTLHNGRIIDFRGSFLIFTTNVGTSQIISDYLDDSKKIGFKPPKHDKTSSAIDDLNETIYRRVIEEIEDPRKGYFLPEFLGRIGRPGIIVFHVLQHEHYRRILHLMLQEQVHRILNPAVDSEQAVSVSYTPELEEFLIHEGISPQYGARALRSVIEKHVKTELASRILKGEIVSQDILLLDVEFEYPEEQEIENRGEARVLIRRSVRKEGIEIKPIGVRSDTPKKQVDVEKILDDFFRDLQQEYVPPLNDDPQGQDSNKK